ncbi:TPA: hypothetical protein QH056_001835 [Klebsiella oxytoca]|nr:hypothetical protein [Klebsiella oxytoca]
MNKTIYLKYDKESHPSLNYHLIYKSGLIAKSFGNDYAALEYAFEHGWEVEDYEELKRKPDANDENMKVFNSLMSLSKLIQLNSNYI